MFCGNTFNLYSNGLRNKFFFRFTKKRYSFNISEIQLSKIPDNITSKINSSLHKNPNHPIYLVREYLEKLFQDKRAFSVHNDLSPIVSVKQNFDDLLIPKEHPSRSKSDTYYINESYCLRTHTTAHQLDLLKSNSSHFLYSGHVFRKDEVDYCHYPVFHQMDGVSLFTFDELRSRNSSLEFHQQKDDSGNTKVDSKCIQFLISNLKTELEDITKKILGENVSLRWIETYFPFTEPSLELEVYFNNRWIEMFGCGVIRNKILCNAGIFNKIGWAFGIGLERIAMTLYQIPDIRLFWSTDERFLDQFKKTTSKDHFQRTLFVPFSHYNPCYKDISMWIPSTFSDNDFVDYLRSSTFNWLESVKKIDDFKDKNGAQSRYSNGFLCSKIFHKRTFRIIYRSLERTLSNHEVNEVHSNLLSNLETKFNVVVRRKK